MKTIGQSQSRVDGRLKVTGGALYAADRRLEKPVRHAVLVGAAIPAGEILNLDTSEAERAPGVIKILTHRNAPKLTLPMDAPPAGQKNLPLQGATIHFEGEPIAVVVADTLENATHAAKLVRAEYRKLEYCTDYLSRQEQAIDGQGFFPSDTKVGEVDAALKTAAVKIEQSYSTLDRHHHAIEPAATTCEWREGQLHVATSTQGVQAARLVLAKLFGLEPTKVQVTSPFVGGGFGGKGWLWPHQALCALAAREVGQPVKLVLQRSQDFTCHGYQPATLQKVVLGAKADGTLVAVRHTSLNPTSIEDDYLETCAMATRGTYATPNLETQTRMVRVNRNVPTPMRAPHEGPGLVGIEIAMDELAYALKMDPLALRLKNYAEKDPNDGRPFSAKKLRECYEEGARRFGWSRRTAAPRAMSDGSELVGWGMATAIMGTFRQPAKARASLDQEGRLLIEGSTQEIGTGSATVITQIAAEALGVSVDRVQLIWGEAHLPEAPMTAGSTTTLSFGSAVHDAVTKLKQTLLGLAKAPDLPTSAYSAVVKNSGQAKISADGEWAPGQDSDPLGQPKDVALNSYGAVFVEVRLHPELLIPRVTRAVGVFNAGRIINPKTARSQLIGGFTWGLGQALLEKSPIDHRLGRYLSKNLAGSLVPVNPDVPELDLSFIEEPDFACSVLGARGIGELSACGTGPAIANAVFHATGKRIRELPIAPETLL